MLRKKILCDMRGLRHNVQCQACESYLLLHLVNSTTFKLNADLFKQCMYCYCYCYYYQGLKNQGLTNHHNVGKEKKSTRDIPTICGLSTVKDNHTSLVSFDPNFKAALLRLLQWTSSILLLYMSTVNSTEQLHLLEELNHNTTCYDI